MTNIRSGCNKRDNKMTMKGKGVTKDNKETTK